MLQLVLGTLRQDGTPLDVQDASFRILGHLVSIPGSFMASERALFQEERAKLVLPTLNKNLEVLKGLTEFLDEYEDDPLASPELRCLVLWIRGLHSLQNRPLNESFNFLKQIIQNGLINRFDSDVQDANKATGLLVVLDVVELFVWHVERRVTSTTSAQLAIVGCQLMETIERKIPTDAAQLKKLVPKTNTCFEKVICGIIQLCLSIFNATAHVDHVTLMSKLHRTGS